MKKNLFIVRTGFQLLQAFHIRAKMIFDESSDIILLSDKFDSRYVDRLKQYFNRVILIGNEEPSRFEKYLFFFFPGLAIRKFAISGAKNYTDIWFYNPGWCFYLIKRIDRIHHYKYSYHVIQDALSNYIEYYETLNYSLYGNGIIQRFFSIFDNAILEMKRKEYDEYLWKPELKQYESGRKIIEVPQIDIEDEEYVKEINYIFGYEKTEVDFGYIYLDTVHGVYDDELVNKLIKNLADKYRKDFLLFAHPAEKLSTYHGLGFDMEIRVNHFPFELLAINGILKDKTIFGLYTSAVVTPFIICDCNYNAVSYSKYYCKDSLGKEYVAQLEKADILFDTVEKWNVGFIVKKIESDPGRGKYHKY